MLFALCMLIECVPSAFANTWTKNPPYNGGSYSAAWRGDHYPERLTWSANASAFDNGNMHACLVSWMDGVGYLNVHFETGVYDDLVYATRDGYLAISAVVTLTGHARVWGVCAVAGGFSVGWSLDLFLVVDDMTTGSNVLNWKVNTWEDSDGGLVGNIVDRTTDFDWDYVTPQTSVPVEKDHAYRVGVKFAGWAGTTSWLVAATQANIGTDFETDPFYMQLKWLTYDGPATSPIMLTVDARDQDGDMVPTRVLVDRALVGERWTVRHIALSPGLHTIEVEEEIYLGPRLPCMKYSFQHWNDGVSDNPRTIDLQSATTYTAIYWSHIAYRKK